MSLDLIKKFYSEGDEYDIINLLKLCFREWKNYDDLLNYWKWKYIDVPGGSTIVVVKQNENLIAVSHRMYPYIKIGDTVLMSGFGDDFATHPDFRVKGLFKDLQNFTEAEGVKRGMQVIVSVNSNPITIKNNLQRGRLVLPHKIEHMVFINDARLHFKNINIKYSGLYSIIFNILKAANKINGVIFPLNIVDGLGNSMIKKTSYFDERYDFFWNKINDNYKFINVKDKEFLNWRYSDRRGGNYIIYEVSGYEELLGFMVIEVKNNHKYKSGYIMELLSLPHRRDIIIQLINQLKIDMCDLGINILNFKTTSKETIKLLESLGFIRMPYTKDFQAMFTFINAEAEKNDFLAAGPDEIYFGYGNYF